MYAVLTTVVHKCCSIIDITCMNIDYDSNFNAKCVQLIRSRTGIKEETVIISLMESLSFYHVKNDNFL